MSKMQSLHVESALLPEGMASDVIIDIDPGGIITDVTPNAGSARASRAQSGCALPGMANLHSHAHQRAMAGLAERSGASADSFWTWRNIMYGFLEVLTPDHVNAIAAQLYVEMLKAGYTHVAEFQYLHHQPNGKPYEQRGEMSLQTLNAADDAGMGMTCLPVLYQYSGFNRQPIEAQQRRFYNSPDDFLRIVDDVRAVTHAKHHVGVAAHSLRAVDAAAFNRVLSSDSVNDTLPVHIHIAEQLREVTDCVAWCQARPVDYLLEHFDVNDRWCLIHATHMTPDETRRLANSGAVAGLCPTTEANLGDGLFNATEYINQNGAWGIGSDSHISVSPVEELRWLEYGQRLLHHSRNELADGPDRSTGRYLWSHGARFGHRACGHRAGVLASGYRADVIVLDSQHPLLAERTGDALIDSFIFSGNQNVVRDVFIGGRQVITHGRHAAEENIEQRFVATLKELRLSL